MEEESSHLSESFSDNADEEDFVEDEGEEDDEATLDEEEALLEDEDGELDELKEEADLDIEELRRRYGYGDATVATCTTTAEGEDGGSGTNQDLEAATRSYFALDEEGEGDEDYHPPEDKKEIRVGEPFQAAIPEFKGEVHSKSLSSEEEESDERGIVLWTPPKNGTLTDVEIGNFVQNWIFRKLKKEYIKKGEEVKEDELIADPTGRISRSMTKDLNRDDEDALLALLLCAYSRDEAAQKFPAEAANGIQLTKQSDEDELTEEEKKLFEDGMKTHKKNFRLIHNNFVKTRSTGELIQYYYKWKKTARYTAFRASRPNGLIPDDEGDYMADVMGQMESHNKHHSHHHHVLSEGGKYSGPGSTAEAASHASNGPTITQATTGNA